MNCIINIGDTSGSPTHAAARGSPGERNAGFLLGARVSSRWRRGQSTEDCSRAWNRRVASPWQRRRCSPTKPCRHRWVAASSPPPFDSRWRHAAARCARIAARAAGPAARAAHVSARACRRARSCSKWRGWLARRAAPPIWRTARRWHSRPPSPAWCPRSRRSSSWRCSTRSR